MNRDDVLSKLEGRTTPEQGLTAEELSVLLYSPVAMLRNTLAELVFTRHGKPPVSKFMVTCDEKGRYFHGDPQPLYDQGAMR